MWLCSNISQDGAKESVSLVDEESEIREGESNNFMKYKHFYSSKWCYKMKRQVTNWEIVFTKHMSNKGVISGIYEEISQLKKKTTN
jgi:hypothetical protein